MIDRKTVIKGLECCSEMSGDECRECPYGRECLDNDLPYGMPHLAADALALLKEQEAVEPTFKQGEDGIFVWCCGSCGAYMYHIYDGIDKAKEYAKYCRQCGRPVLWEGR